MVQWTIFYQNCSGKKGLQTTALLKFTKFYAKELSGFSYKDKSSTSLIGILKLFFFLNYVGFVLTWSYSVIIFRYWKFLFISLIHVQGHMVKAKQFKKNRHSFRHLKKYKRTMGHIAHLNKSSLYHFILFFLNILNMYFLV